MAEDRLLELLEKQSAILEQLVSKEKDALHTKQPANHSTYTPLHGPGGIWQGPGLERDVVTAHVRPHGIASQLPLLPTNRTNPLFGTLTGYPEPTGSQPAESCDDAPQGYVKGATLTAQLGLFRFDSQTIDMDDVMLTLHRGDFTDLVLRGQVLGLTNLNPQDTNERDILNVVSASEMVIMGVNTERALSRQLWQGNIANGEFPGLDLQIATGQVDALSGVSVPALDSDVKDFGMDVVGGTGRDIVEYLSMLEFYLRYNADKMGATPVDWVVVMRPELWFEVSAIWPCAYNTTRCVSSMVGEGARTFIDGRENVAERDAMRNGNYIDINGNRYRVVTDTGIFEMNSTNTAGLLPGQYASSIYMVPIRAYGMTVTYREYLDYRLAARDVAYTRGQLDAWWTDNGVYAWALTQNKWCYKFHLKTQQRVILRTPQLAGRIDGIAYEPLQHLREGYPDSPYFMDGGVSLGANAPDYSAVWKP